MKRRRRPINYKAGVNLFNFEKRSMSTIDDSRLVATQNRGLDVIRKHDNEIHLRFIVLLDYGLISGAFPYLLTIVD